MCGLGLYVPMTSRGLELRADLGYISSLVLSYFFQTQTGKKGGNIPRLGDDYIVKGLMSSAESSKTDSHHHVDGN